MKRTDRKIIFGAIILITIIFIGRSFVFQKEGSFVKVTIDQEEYGYYSLEQDMEYPLLVEEDGTVGNFLIIRNAEAKVVEATCADKLCVNQKAISKVGQSIICLPHRLVIEVVAGETSNIDAVAQ